MPDRRFRVGVQVRPQHTTYASMRDAWRRIEDLGVETLWTWDHFFPTGGDPQGNHFECWTLLAAMAELTRQINQDVVPRLNDALASADRTLASASGMVGEDSPVNQELRRALVELTETTRALGLAADQFEREPESVIWGR